MFCSTTRFRFGQLMAKTRLTWYGYSAFKVAFRKELAKRGKTELREMKVGETITI